MSKKRNANSPMESEKGKQKASTSTAASTLGMAAMLSAVSNVFSSANNDSSSQASESEDEYSQATGGNSTITNDTDNDNPWNEDNLNKSQVKSPKKRPAPLFEHYYTDGAMRDEIEIEFNTKNGRKFSGSITPLEVKHGIYIDSLGFTDHSNFDGVRIGFKGKLVATIKLINPIDIDELCSVEYFDYTRRPTYRGKQMEEVIGCKIKGIRMKQPTASAFESQPRDETKTLVKIEGCEHRVPQDIILAWLANYGTVESELEEDFFVDTKETEATNRTGNYSVMMTLEYKIPQLIPMAGRRIKVYHKGIDKLCTKCFGKHRKSDCKEESKTEWIDYVATFISENPDVPTDLYGRWTELVAKNQKGLFGKPKNNSNDQPQQDSNTHAEETANQTQTQTLESDKAKERATTDHTEDKTDMPERTLAPTPEEFELPENEQQYESMVDRFATIGLKRGDLDKVLESRRTAFNKAVRKFEVAERKRKTEETKLIKKTRKASIAK